MHLFFRLIDRAGIRQSRMAKLMDCSEGYLSRVRTGSKPPSARFQRRGAEAMTEIGIRHPEGRPYTPQELFSLAPPFNRSNETGASITGEESAHAVA